MAVINYIFITINILLCLSLGFGVLLFYQVGKPYVRGYYCFDESISKPLKNDTVTVSALLAFVFTLYSVCIIILEGIKMRKNIGFSKKFVIKVIRHALHILWIFVYGVAITMFITDIGKYSIGRLRPHYLTLCNPDWSNMTCSDNNAFIKLYIVGDDLCRIADRALLKDARMSFPSGHTSFAVYCATFMILYLQIYPLSIPQRRRFSFLLLFIQVILSCLAIFTGLSRVSDYKHHPTDVIAGGIVGLIVAFTIFFNVLKYVNLPFHEKSLPSFGNYHTQLPSVTNDQQLTDVVT